MRKCVNCGAELKAEARFCPECGSNVLEQQESKPKDVACEEKEDIQEDSKKCVNCGTELKAEARFCPECGSNVLEQQENIPNRKNKNNTTELNEKVFHFKKVKMIGNVQYKIITTEVKNYGDNLDVEETIYKFFKKRNPNIYKIKVSEIDTVEVKTKIDFWDALYAVVFGVIYLLDITDIAWLLLIAVFLYTGYGKVVKLKMKNGLKFEIPVDGMSEDVQKFQRLIESAR